MTFFTPFVICHVQSIFATHVLYIASNQMSKRDTEHLKKLFIDN